MSTRLWLMGGKLGETFVVASVHSSCRVFRTAGQRWNEKGLAVVVQLR